MCLRPHRAGSTIPRLWPTGSSAGIAPVDYDPVVLLKPFGPRLAAALQKVVDGGSRLAYPCPGFRRRASLASPYLPSLLAGEALPPPSDISPGPRAEFNPPDASAVRHTLWGSPNLAGASVLSASWGRHLCLFPSHRRPQVPCESPDPGHASYTPDTAWPVSRCLPCSSRSSARFWCHLKPFDASSEVRLRSSPGSLHDAVTAAPFNHDVHYRGFWPKQLMAV